MKRTATGPRVEISADDPSLSGFAGLLLPGELSRRTRLVERLDAAIDTVEPFKERHRGVHAGELLVALSEMMMVGGDHLAHLDVLRKDLAGAELRAIAEPPAPSTASQLLRRLTRCQCEAAIAVMAEIGNEVDVGLGLDPTAPITLDLDATRTEVYGCQKEDAAYSYEGRRCLGSQVVTWAERLRILAAELLAGNASAKPTAAALLRRALDALPAGHGEVRLRGDSDYYFVDLLHACRRDDVRFAVSVPRSSAMWRIQEAIPATAWQRARDMPHAEVAEATYAPEGWKHEPLRLLVRRVRIRAEDLSLSTRSRRRRTIPKIQLLLGLGGALDQVFGYSFILTDLQGDAVEIEHWHRRRAHIEERIKDLKLGCGLEHLPLHTRRANTAWQAATVIAANLMSLLSAVVVAEREERAVVPPDEPDTVSGVVHRPRYRRSATLRRWMLVVPGRIVRGGRRLRLRLPRGAWWANVIIHAYERLRLLPLSG